MPKLKTRKSLAKRIRISKNGKIKYFKPGRRHLMACKSGKRRRQLRKPCYVRSTAFAEKFKSCMHNAEIYR